MKDDRKEWGEFAEQRACDHLLAEGYTIRERNWRPGGSSHLEVDIIAEYGDTIAFVEVKARAISGSDPFDCVDSHKQTKMVRAANAYLQRLEKDYYYRFDIIGVTGTPDDYTLEHVEDAFLPF